MSMTGDVRVWREYGQALVAEAAGLALGVFVPAIVARRWGPSGFGRYSIYFELVAILQPALLVGLGVALPKFLAASDGAQPGGAAERMLVAALCLEAAVVGAFSGVALAARGVWVPSFFGDSAPRRAEWILVALVSASCLFGIVSGYLRGRLWLGRANVLTFSYVGLAPLLSALLASSVEQFFAVLSFVWVCSAAWAGRLGRLGPLPPVRSVLPIARGLAAFGSRRVPGELALFSLFSLPTLMAARSLGVESGGYVAFSISAVTLLGAVFVPVSLVLLPVLSGQLARGELERARRHLRRLVPGTMGISLVMLAAVEMGAPLAVRVYLGPGFQPAVDQLRLIGLAIPGYVLFIVTRSVLDAVHHRPVSLRWAFVALAVLSLVTLGPGLSRSSVGIGFALAMTVLGVGSWVSMMVTVRSPGGPGHDRPLQFGCQSS